MCDSKELLKRKKRKVWLIRGVQWFIVLAFFGVWEYLAYKKIISAFLFSSPSRIVKTLSTLIETGDLWRHLWTTLYETILSFGIGILLGFLIAILLYEIPFVAKVIDPFLTLLNSLPKVALGPMIIIWVGANVKSIIVMALLINLVISILNIYNGFLGTDKNKLKLLTSFGANKKQILWYLVIPESKRTILSSLKINISMTLIGVIMGEFLVSKQGIGYLIIYGTQVFQLNLVMSGILLLLILSFVLYQIVSLVEKKLTKGTM